MNKETVETSFPSKTGQSTKHAAKDKSRAKTKAAKLKAKSEAKSKQKDDRPHLTRGGRNLILLGLGATAIALITTTIGLAIYHVSGDIYLDRSRPGYLPDEAEVVEEAEAEPEEFNFEKTGKIDRSVLEEYLKHLAEELNAVDNYKDPFADSPLSDQTLGLPQN